MSRNQQIIGVFLWWISDGGEKKYKQIEKYLIRTDTNTHSDYCMHQMTRLHTHGCGSGQQGGRVRGQETKLFLHLGSSAQGVRGSATFPNYTTQILNCTPVTLALTCSTVTMPFRRFIRLPFFSPNSFNKKFTIALSLYRAMLWRHTPHSMPCFSTSSKYPTDGGTYVDALEPTR